MTVISTSAASISAVVLEKSPLFCAALRRALKPSCQQGSSFAWLICPSGSMALYVFSAREGGRGIGATMKMVR
jgi:hypothetical protein